MKKADWTEIVVSEEKLVDYLLSLTHPVGRSKARFFRGLGFNEENVRLLEQSLRDIVGVAEESKAIVTAHGTKMVIDGEVKTPQGKHVKIRTVWIDDKGDRVLRFVTAYPLK